MIASNNRVLSQLDEVPLFACKVPARFDFFTLPFRQPTLYLKI